jgi:hypothetical protein
MARMMLVDKREERVSELANRESDLPADSLQNIAEGSIEGIVTSVDGPVANTKLSFGTVVTFTDEKGHFLLEHLPAGIGSISVEPPSGFSSYEQGILIKAGENKESLSIFLTEVTGTIEGIIRGENGIPIAKAEVSGIFDLAKPAVTVKTDEKGHYIFDKIPAGSYRIRAKAMGFSIDGAMANVAAGSATSINFTMRCGNLAVSGNVVSKNGRTPLDSEICLMRNGTMVSKIRSMSSTGGEFKFSDLLPDVYEMEVLSAGYKSKSWHGRLEKSEILDFELEVEIGDTCSP